MDFFTPAHLLIIAVVGLIVLVGWKKLPDMSRSVGRSLRIFKSEIKALDTDVRDAVTPEPARTETAAAEPVAATRAAEQIR